jgi:hypothetical protein
MFELIRPLLISIFVIIILCLIIKLIQLKNASFIPKQISNYNIYEIMYSLELLIIISVIIGYNSYKYILPSFDIETMIEYDKYLIDN